MAVARHKLVPLFGPPLKPYYTRSELKEFLLTKIINAENACHSVNKFAEMAKRTRCEYLTELCNKRGTTTTVQQLDAQSTPSSFNSIYSKLFGSSSSSSSDSSGNASKSKHKSVHGDVDALYSISGGGGNGTVASNFSRTFPVNRRHILSGIKDPPTLHGAIMFSHSVFGPQGAFKSSRLFVRDFSTNRDLPATLVISNEAILVVDSTRSEVIWAAPVTCVIGWTDSSGVFATSPSTSCVTSTMASCVLGGPSGKVASSRHSTNLAAVAGGQMSKGSYRAKSVDSEPNGSSSGTCKNFVFLVT